MPADLILTTNAVVITSEPGDATPNNGGRLEIPGKDGAIEMTDGQSRTVIKSGDVNVVGSVRANVIETPAVDLKPAAFGEGRPGGRLTLHDKNAMPTIELSADNGDIRLHSIGSLVDKIKDLERRLAALEQ